MIRIDRGDEVQHCPALAAVRTRELERVRPRVTGFEGPWDELLGRGYDAARDPLARLQHYKCCYCEAKQNSRRYHTTDHIRPKSHYWWLTWTWENLLFACHDCNNAKADAYPLKDERTRLQAEQQPPGGEDPLLVDPSREDPREHIFFRPLGPLGPWLPVARTPYGRETLRLLGWVGDHDDWKQPGLIQQWQDHVGAMRSTITLLRYELAQSTRGVARQSWDAHTSHWRRASQPFVALSLDVLQLYLSTEIDRHGLPLTILH